MSLIDAINELDETGFSPENLRQALGVPLEHRPEKDHRPWHDWTDPVVIKSPLHMLRLDTFMNHEVEGGYEIHLIGADGALAKATHGLLTGLAEFTTFPTEFVEKLSPRLACAVVNERIGKATAMEAAAIIQDGQAMRLTEGSREIVPASMLAEFVDDWTIEHFGGSTVEQATYDGRQMRLWVNLPVEAPVTPAVGDTLRAGLLISQEYGDPIHVSLTTTRLVCTNGMTANKLDYSWRSKDSRDIDSQLAWVAGACDGCFHSFLPLVERAREMAEARFSGDYHAVLRNSARAMRLPGRYIPDLIAAFEEEPGDTHWSLLNAFTRLATHGGLPERVRYAVEQSAGDWTARFQLVTAELPRPMASLVGARILEAS